MKCVLDFGPSFLGKGEEEEDGAPKIKQRKFRAPSRHTCLMLTHIFVDTKLLNTCVWRDVAWMGHHVKMHFPHSISF